MGSIRDEIFEKIEHISAFPAKVDLKKQNAKLRGGLAAIACDPDAGQVAREMARNILKEASND